MTVTSFCVCRARWIYFVDPVETVLPNEAINLATDSSSRNRVWNFSHASSRVGVASVMVVITLPAVANIGSRTYVVNDDGSYF